MTECRLRGNNLGVKGWSNIFNALRDSPNSKIAKWDLSGESLGVEIAKPLAEYIAVAASLTKILVGSNKLGNEGTIILCDALRANTISKVEELDLSANGIGPEGAKVVATMAAAVGSITEVR